MAEFCTECNQQVFGAPSDFAGIAAPGELVQVLCEGCGLIWVDSDGKRVDPPAQESTSTKKTP